jgi:2-keto-4-pentenoate hydratase/2-oxohepta-3-ene-1,7-dioic acid hydratase in catechol pathway
MRLCRFVTLLSPVANPGKILAAPVNYRKHLDEARGDPAIHHQKQVAEIQGIGRMEVAVRAV